MPRFAGFFASEHRPLSTKPAANCLISQYDRSVAAGRALAIIVEVRNDIFRLHGIDRRNDLTTEPGADVEHREGRLPTGP